MLQIDKIEKKISRIDEDLVTAREKLEEWRGKIAVLEKEREAAENLRIVQIVRNTEITPEMLKQILSMQNSKTETFVATSVLPEVIPETKEKSNIERNFDNEEID